MTRSAHPSPWRRLSVVRLIVVVLLIGVAVLSFAAPLGSVRGLFRGLLVLGVIVIAVSYLVDAVRRRRGR